MHKKLTLYFLAGSLMLNPAGIYAIENNNLTNTTYTIEGNQSGINEETVPEIEPLEVEGGTGEEVKPEIEDGTEEEVKPEIEGGTEEEVKPEIEGGTEEEVKPEVEDGTEEEVKPEVEGETEEEVKPEIEGGTEEAPFDDILGTYEDLSDIALFKVESQQVMLFGEQMTLAIPPQVIDGRTLLPLRFIGEKLLEAQVDYEPSTKKIIVSKEGLTVELTVGSKRVYVNGEEVIMDTMPIIQAGTTLLPLRFLAEQFELGIHYDSESKIIEVKKPVVIPNTAPVASFSFKEETYTVGQTVEAEVETYDEDGHEIINQRWMLEHKSSQVYPTLEALSKKLEPNFVAISLQVQDERGMWSEWYTEYIIIKPNSAPVITEFKAKESKYAQGEPLDFEFDYINEDFEGIKGEKWSYRQVDERLNQSILQKPSAIYEKGEYIVTLELQDDAGNWSEKKETIVEITSESLESEFEHIFKNGKPGDIITNFGGTNFRDYKPVDFEEEDERGTLIMSNSPEVVVEEGILYEEYVEGDGRMMFHHINNFNSVERKKLMVIVENQGLDPVQGTIVNQVVKGPSSDVLFVGQQLLHDYLGTDTRTNMTIMPGEAKVIYDSSAKNWLRNHAISGMFEFDFDKEVKITVVAMGVNESIESISNLGYPARDVHPRGTFDVINKEIRVDLSGQNKPSKLLIGQGEDEWLIGYDGITGETVMNKGNFGVEHHITITAEEDTAVILNPRGNMYKGSIKWEGEAPFMTPKSGYFPDSKRAAFLGIIKAGTTRTFTYVLPNGSSAPVLIGFIPEDDWN